MINTSPFASLKHCVIAGKTMTYIDEGEGDPIVCQHGNPTSSYLWRNVMPSPGRPRPVDRLRPDQDGQLRQALSVRARSLSLAEQRDYLFALPPFRGLRSPAGEELILEQNAFVEVVLPGSVLRRLSDEKMGHYRRPIGGEPADVVAIVEAYSSWLAESDVPKLFVNAEPGAIINDRVRAEVRRWPNQIETTVAGIHYLQEDSPDQIGLAIANFVHQLRHATVVA